MILQFLYLLATLTYSPKEDLANRVCKQTEREIEQKLGVRCCGSGGGAVYEINVLSLSFRTEKPCDIDEARVLILEAADIFHRNVNAYPPIRPYLRRYPFPYAACQISLFFPDKNVIDSAGTRRQGITYIMNDDYYRTERGNLIILEETYEEARERANQIKAGIRRKLSLDEQMAPLRPPAWRVNPQVIVPVKESTTPSPLDSPQAKSLQASIAQFEDWVKQQEAAKKENLN